MDTEALTRYLHEHIPLTGAMALQAVAASPQRVELALPLAANRNHKGTMFGGSLAALATLACWSLVHVRMQRDALAGELVVMRSEMDYLAPATDACAGVCEFTDESAWSLCTRMLARRGRARLTLTSTVSIGDTCVATFDGAFAIVR